MPLDNPYLPYKPGDYHFAQLPRLPHGNYPPGTPANTADRGPCFVSEDGSEWVVASEGGDGEGGDSTLPAEITPLKVLAGNATGDAFVQPPGITLGELTGTIEVTQNDDGGIALTGNGDGGITLLANGAGGLSARADGDGGINLQA